MASVAEKVRAGDILAVARLIRDIDDGMPEVKEVLKELYPFTGEGICSRYYWCSRCGQKYLG